MNCRHVEISKINKTSREWSEKEEKNEIQFHNK